MPDDSHEDQIINDIQNTNIPVDESDIFIDALKDEWINACFGKDFLIQNNNNNNIGICGSYQMKTILIPARITEIEKVGITISRLAVGVYVRQIADYSEAAVAGIQLNSILISINNVPVLAEPSKQLLERLWQYEGCSYTNNNNNTVDDLETTNNIEQNNNNNQQQQSSTTTVELQFIKDGKIYSVLLLSAPWGIQWAPVTNLPLVKRVSSQAADSGLSKGCIMAAVNGRTFRGMDHIATALHIREIYTNRQTIRCIVVFPPQNARPAHYEKINQNNDITNSSTIIPPSSKNRHYKNSDGIEIKFLPLGYAIGSLCSSDNNVFYEVNSNKESTSTTTLTVEQLAEGVAAGKIEPPFIKKPITRSGKLRYLPCPKLLQQNLLNAWDPIQALVFCLQFQQTALVRNNNIIMRSSSNKLLQQCGKKQQQLNSIEILHQIVSGPHGADAVTNFLLQFISMICSPDINRDHANELTSMLLKLSRKNEAFCQRLYFLLRSFISTFETNPPTTTIGSSPQNLMALLNCLELLRFAEKELAGRCSDQHNNNNNNSTSFTQKKSNVLLSDSPTMIGQVVESVPTPIPASPESPPNSSPKGKGKMLNLFRKGGRSSSRSPVKQRPLQPEGQSPQPIVEQQSRRWQQSTPVQESESLSLVQSPSTMYDNMADFLSELDKICATIERSLQKSFRQKIADWAMQPWSAGKDAALAQVTADMRTSLENAAGERSTMLLVNPVESTELLSSVDYDECYILPSAHFPILLTFNVSERRCSDSIVGEELLYRTQIELLSLQSKVNLDQSSFIVQGAVAGSVASSNESKAATKCFHKWGRGSGLSFETMSSWGAPQTLYLRLSGTSDNFDKRGNFSSEVGFCWIDLSRLWESSERSGRGETKRIRTDVWPIESAIFEFDDHGDLPPEAVKRMGEMQLEVQITTEIVDFDSVVAGDSMSRKRMLLYKHDDDLRQEAFAAQFIKTCDDILKESGLDMKLLTFQCIPVGTKRGFVEWIPGSVPLSEICDSFGSILPGKTASEVSDVPSMMTKAGLSKYKSLRRLGRQQNDTLRLLSGSKPASRGSIANNPVQDYLRSVAFDPTAPYLIRQDVMDSYVKSCAGYSIITYILGVGDRHLDNLLLHQSGRFFHCDYSFILGSDPKKFMPIRITEDMIYGMGGKESDNYAKFLSLVGAAFLAIRRPENARILLSAVRLMNSSCIPDISQNQTIEDAILGMKERFRLDLTESAAIAYIEDLVEASLSNRMWLAVDAIHQIGKNL